MLLAMIKDGLVQGAGEIPLEKCLVAYDVIIFHVIRHCSQIDAVISAQRVDERPESPQALCFCFARFDPMKERQEKPRVGSATLTDASPLLVYFSKKNSTT